MPGAPGAFADDQQPPPPQSQPDQQAQYNEVVGYDPGRLDAFLSQQLSGPNLQGFGQLLGPLEEKLNAGQRLSDQELSFYKSVVKKVNERMASLDPNHPDMGALNDLNSRLAALVEPLATTNPEALQGDGEGSEAGEPPGGSAAENFVNPAPAAAAAKGAAASVAGGVAQMMDGSRNLQTQVQGPPPSRPPGPAPRTPAPGSRPTATAPAGPTFGADGRGQGLVGHDYRIDGKALPAPAAAAVVSGAGAPGGWLALLQGLWTAFRSPAKPPGAERPASDARPATRNPSSPAVARPASPPPMSAATRALVTRMLGVDEDDRDAAIVRLLEDERAVKEAIPGLLEAYRGDDSERSLRAAAALTRIGPRNQDALDALARIMLGKDSHLSNLAEYSMSHSALPGRLGLKVPPDLIRALGAPGVSDELRRHVLSVINSIGLRSQEDLDGLMGLLQRPDSIGGRFALALLSMAPADVLARDGDRIRTALAPYLADGAPAGPRRLALEVLGKLGPAGVGSVVGRIRAPSQTPPFKAETAKALGGLGASLQGEERRQALAWLEQQLSSEDAALRIAAAQALERLEPGARGPALVRALAAAGPEAAPALGSHLRNKDAALRRSALEGLSRMGAPGAREIVTALLDLDDRVPLLADAPETLSRMGAPAVPAIVDGLKKANDPRFSKYEEQTSLALAGALRRLGPAGREAAPAMRDLLAALAERDRRRWVGHMDRGELLASGEDRDREARVGFRLALALAAVAPQDAQAALPVLAGALRGGTPWEHGEAVKALVAMGPAGLPAFRDAVKWAGDTEARLVVIADLERLAREDGIYVAPLADVLKDDTQGEAERAAAIAALTRLGSKAKDAIEPLIAMMSSPNSSPNRSHRLAAMDALAAIDVADERFVKALEAVALRPNQSPSDHVLRAKAAELLGRSLALSPPRADDLLAGLRGSWGDVTASDPHALKALIQVLRGDAEPDVRLAAQKALWSLGPGQPGGMEDLSLKSKLADAQSVAALARLLAQARAAQQRGIPAAKDVEALRKAIDALDSTGEPVERQVKTAQDILRLIGPVDADADSGMRRDGEDLERLARGLSELRKGLQENQVALRAMILSDEEKRENMRRTVAAIDGSVNALWRKGGEIAGNQRYIGSPFALRFTDPSGHVHTGNVYEAGTYEVTGGDGKKIRFQVTEEKHALSYNTVRVHFTDEGGRAVAGMDDIVARTDLPEKATLLPGLNTVWYGGAYSAVGADNSTKYAPKVAAQFNPAFRTLNELRALQDDPRRYDEFVKKLRDSHIDGELRRLQGRVLPEFAQGQASLISGTLNTIVMVMAIPTGGSSLAGRSLMGKAVTTLALSGSWAATQVTIDQAAKHSGVYDGLVDRDQLPSWRQSAVQGGIFGLMGPLGELNGYLLGRLAANSGTMRAAGFIPRLSAAGSVVGIEGTSVSSRLALSLAQSMVAMNQVGAAQRFIDAYAFNEKTKGNLAAALAEVTRGDAVLHDTLFGAGFGIFHFGVQERQFRQIQGMRDAMQLLDIDPKTTQLDSTQLTDKAMAARERLVAQKLAGTLAEGDFLEALRKVDRAYLDLMGIDAAKARAKIRELEGVPGKEAELEAYRQALNTLDPAGAGDGRAARELGRMVRRSYQGLRDWLGADAVDHGPRPWFGGRLRAPFAAVQNGNVWLGRAFGLVPGSPGVAASYGRGAVIVERPGLGRSTLEAHLVSPVTGGGAESYRADVRAGMASLAADAPRLARQGYASIDVEAHSQKVLNLFQKYGFKPIEGAHGGFDLNFWLIEKFGLLPADDVVLGRPVKLRLDLGALREPAAPGAPDSKAPAPMPAPGAELSGRPASLPDIVRHLFDLRAGAPNGVVPAPQLNEVAGRLRDLGPLPAETPARQAKLAEVAGRELGVSGPVELTAPGTPPLSGDQVFLVRQGEKVVGVVKVLRSQAAAANLLAELGGAETIGRLGPARSRVVQGRAAFRAGPGELVYVMEAAPGRDLYAALRSVGEARGEDARGRAFAEASSDVESVARVLGEIHRLSRAERPAQAGLDYDVSSARRMLGELRGKVPADVYAAMERHLDRLGPAVQAGGVPGAVIHGDAHPGNFFSGDGVTIIDVATALYSVDPNGRPVGNPAADVGRFLEAVRLNNASKGLHLTDAELGRLERSFLDAYAGESGISPGALRSNVDFYRLRLTLAAMRSDSAHLDSYVRSARSLLGELDGAPSAIPELGVPGTAPRPPAAPARGAGLSMHAPSAELYLSDVVLGTLRAMLRSYSKKPRLPDGRQEPALPAP